MKLQAKFLRLAGAVLTAGLTLGVLWPLMTADATTIDIDSSAFADPTVTVRTVYVWQQGLPAYAGDNAEPKACPVLFTWDDKYYWKVSKEFAKCCKNNIGFYASMIKHGYSTNKKDSGYINGSFDADGSMPHGNFCQNLGYTGTTLSSLKSTIDVDALRSAGSYLTFTKPEGVPELTAVRGSGDSVAVSSGNWGGMAYGNTYTITVELPSGGYWMAEDYKGERYEYGGFRRGKNLIFGIRYDIFDHWVDDHWYGDTHHQSTAFVWTLHGGNQNVIKYMDSWYQNSLTEQRRLSGRMLNPKRGDSKSSDLPYKLFGWTSRSRKVNGRWYYCFFSPGFYVHDINGHWCDEMSDAKKLKNLIMDDNAKLTLSHKDGDFGTKGRLDGNIINSIFYGVSSGSDFSWSDIAFNCYYGLPTTMNVINTSFTVENGQVSNFDVATALQNGAVCTVKDGGTLSVEGFLLNNGTIKIEEGGTLYIQDGGCICRYNDGTSRGGNIDCKGLILIGENAKLVGGGTSGIKLGNGAHVVNYGLMATENFEVANDHTVENRGQGFTLIGAGYGVLGGGSGTYSLPLDYTNKTFSECGGVESNVTVRYNGHESDWEYHE